MICRWGTASANRRGGGRSKKTSMLRREKRVFFALIRDLSREKRRCSVKNKYISAYFHSRDRQDETD